jgi:hypothetical protein
MHRAYVVVVTIILLFARHAVAQEAQTKPDAQTLFDDATRLMTERRYAEACAKFAESNRLDPALGTILHLGECYEKIGQTASAWTTFRAAAQVAHDKDDPRESAARDHIAKLESVLFKLELIVDGTAEPLDLEVRRDGVVIPQSAWQPRGGGRIAEIVLDPGTHVVTASAPLHRTWDKNIEALPTGGSVTVTIPPLVAEHVSTPPAPVPVSTRRDRGWLTVGWTLAAVGLVGGVAFGSGFGLDAKSKLDTSNGAPHNCQPSPSTPGLGLCADQEGVTLRQQALASALASTIAFVAGGVLIAAGIVIVLAAPAASVHLTVGAITGTF